MIPRWLTRPIFAAAVGAALFACVDGESPTAQDLRLRSSFAIQPDYSAVLSFGQLGEITRIRLTARDAATSAVVPPTPSVFEVDPSLDEWDLPLELEVGEFDQVIVLMELISVVGGVETVEFSGETAPLSVAPGSTQSVAQAEVHPGNPENLAATSVTIASAPDELREGDDAALSASVGGVSAPDVFWTSLDPTIAQVEKTGATSATVEGLLPGTARVVAAAGTRRDTVSLQILQRPASVVLSPSSAELESLEEVVEFSAVILDPRGAPVSGESVDWEVDGPAVLEHLGNGRFRAIANGATDVRATVDGFENVSGSADVNVAQVAASVTVTPGDATLEAIDETVELEVLVEDALGNPIEGLDVTWSSSNETAVSVNDAGVARAEAEGEADITATAGGAVGTAEITVHQRVDEVEVEPGSHTFEAIGDSHVFTAVVLDPNGHEIHGRSITWSSTDDDVVDVDDDGTATAVGDGDANVRAVVEGEAGAAAVEVDQRAVEIEITPGTHRFTALGDEHTFSAEARDARGNVIAGRSPDWSSSAPGIVKVNDDGEATAVANGDATLTAKMDGVTATADVEVEQEVASVSVAPEAHTLVSIGETVTLTASARDANDNPIAGAAFTWSSDAPGAAKVNSAGVVTAVANGEAEITASSGGESASADITVEQRVASLTVDPDEHTFHAVGESIALTVRAFDARGERVPSAGLDFDWDTTDDDVVTVDANGKVTAVGGGDATVTVEHDGEEASASFSVIQEVAEVEIDPVSVTVDALGRTVQFTAVARDANGNEMEDVEFEWSSSDTDVATVDDDGLVTTVGNGTANIEAEVDGIDADATITVRQTAATIELAPAELSFHALDQTQTLTATVRDANGRVIEDASVGWFSLNTDVATVNGAGVVTAVAEGTARIEAREQGKVAGVSATVRQRAKTVEVEPASHTFAHVGDTITFDAVVRDSTGHLITDEAVTWSSTNTGVATVTSAGFVTATGEGNATIKAKVNGVVGTAAVEVEEEQEDVIVDRVLVIYGGSVSYIQSENALLMAALREAMPDVEFDSLFGNDETPTLEYLHTFDAVLVWQDGGYGNQTTVGNTLADYFDEGGNIVIGVFTWGNMSGVPNNGSSGLGNLENIAPFKQGGNFGGTHQLDLSTVVSHPLTQDINSLQASSWRGGVMEHGEPTVVAWWTDGVPLIGFKTGTGGQRIVGISAFPGHYYFDGGFSGDFTQLWVNALNWAGGANGGEAEGAYVGALRAGGGLIRRSVPAVSRALVPPEGGSSSSERQN